MKRILVVLTLLALCSMGFSVSGKVYGRLLPSTTANTVRGWYAAENGWGLPLDDLRVGRQGTGVSVNFDSFTLDYKYRAPINGYGYIGTLITAYSNALTGTAVGAGANLVATSPGYFQISGIKAGPLDLGIGASWWTLGQSVANLQTNGAGATNANYANGTIGYNIVAFDLTYNLQVGDIRFHADPWNKADFYFDGGSLNLVTGPQGVNTNVGTGGGYSVFFPLNIDYSMEAFSLTIETKFGFNGRSGSLIINNATNLNTSSGFQAGGVAKIGYVVNELVAIFVGAGVEVNGSSSQTIDNANNTNTVTANNMFAPLMGGITLTASPALTFNLGIGYDLILSGETLDKTGATTNSDVFPESRFQSEWDTYEMHGYWHPLIKFAANTKFAGDFSAGLVYLVMLNEASGAGNNGGFRDQNSHNTFGYTRIGNWLNFQNVPDFDAYGGSCAYLGYAKDNFEIKGWIGNETQLAGLFSAIDFTIKY